MPFKDLLKRKEYGRLYYISYPPFPKIWPDKQCLGCSVLIPPREDRKRRKNYCEECIRSKKAEYARRYYHLSDKAKPSRDRAFKKHQEKYKTDIRYRLYTRSRARAQSEGMDFNITQEDIIVPDICPILKTPFEYKTYYTASLDRIDSLKGYVKGNIQVLSHKANAMKNSATDSELLMFADWINLHIQKTPRVEEFKNFPIKGPESPDSAASLLKKEE